MRRIAFPLLILLLLTACGGERPPEQLDRDEVERITVYVGGDEQWIAPLFARFTERTGVEIETLQGETPEMIRLLLGEGAYSGADLFVAPHTTALEEIGRVGMLARLPDELLDSLPQPLRAASGEWVALPVGPDATEAAPRCIGIVRESDSAIELVRLMLSDEGRQLLGY